MIKLTYFLYRGAFSSLENEVIQRLEVTLGANACRHRDVGTGAEGINGRARRIAATVFAGNTAAAARRTATLTVHLTVNVVVAAGLTRRTAALARRTAAPGTTKLLVIGVVKGDCGVNAAGPGRVSIAVRQRGLLRWGLNEGVIAGPNGGGMINHLLFLTQEINKR